MNLFNMMGNTNKQQSNINAFLKNLVSGTGNNLNITISDNNKNLYNYKPNGINKTIHYECLRLKNSNKKGVLVPDENGCYEIAIGALGAKSANGGYYDYEGSNLLFSENSSFKRRIARGVVRGEYGHPVRTPGMSLDEYRARLLKIEEKNVCCEFTEIWLGKGFLTDNGEVPIAVIYAKVRPMGPYKDVLKQQLETPGMQCCFSIRSFTRDYYDVSGQLHKKIDEIVTFDYVNEPGMYCAEKLLSPALESIVEGENISSCDFKIDDFINKNSSDGELVFSNESNGLDLKHLFGLEELKNKDDDGGLPKGIFSNEKKKKLRLNEWADKD